jgi:hypothetical protein
MIAAEEPLQLLGVVLRILTLAAGVTPGAHPIPIVTLYLMAVISPYGCFTKATAFWVSP